MTVVTPPPEDTRRVEELERLRSASPRQLEVATERYKLLGRAKAAQGTVPARTLRGWREAFREAEAVYGHGFLGLIPQWNKSGNASAIFLHRATGPFVGASKSVRSKSKP